MSDSHEIQLREASDDERETILMVTQAAYAEMEAWLPTVNWRGLSHAIRRGVMEAENVTFIVAEREGEVVGSVIYSPASNNVKERRFDDTDWPQLRHLVVHPSARGLGLGRRLMEACIDKARREGAAVLALHTGDSMRVAQPMYVRRGFERVPKYDFAVPRGEPVLAYALKLDDASG